MLAGLLQHGQAPAHLQAGLHRAPHVGCDVALDQIRVGGVGRDQQRLCRLSSIYANLIDWSTPSKDWRESRMRLVAESLKHGKLVVMRGIDDPSPLGELFRDHWKETLGGTFGVVACFCIYYIATAFALGYGTTTLAIPRETFLQVQLVLFLLLYQPLLQQYLPLLL